MTTLRDFISTRKAEIKAQVKALRKELHDLKLAESALGVQAIDPLSSNTVGAAPTIKDMIRSVLKPEAAGLTSTEILDKIKARFGRQVERTSLSPQLSRMKEDGEVSLSENNSWIFVEVEVHSRIPQAGQGFAENAWVARPNLMENEGEDEFDDDSPF